MTVIPADVATAAHVVSSLLLDAPGDDLVAILHDASAVEDWPLEDEVSRAALVAIAAATDDRESLVDDQFQLFVGPGRGSACPYESVQLSEDELLYGEETVGVTQFYEHLGVTPNTVDKVPEDHIGLEFAFVAMCCQRMESSLLADERAAAEQLLRVFLAEHLDELAPVVFAQVREHARTTTYRLLPDIAEACLAGAHRLVD